MRFFPKSKKVILLRQFVGEAIETNTKEKIDLSISMSTMAPIIAFPDGSSVIFDWEDLLKIAEDYKAKEETKQEEK